MHLISYTLCTKCIFMYIVHVYLSLVIMPSDSVVLSRRVEMKQIKYIIYMKLKIIVLIINC